MARSGLGNINPKPKPTPTKKKPKAKSDVLPVGARGRHGRNEPISRDKRVGVSVSAEELQQLRLWAAHKGVSMAELLRQAAWETLGNDQTRQNFLDEK